MTWQSLVSVDVTVSVDPADCIAAFESERITALLIFLCRGVDIALYRVVLVNCDLEGI